MAKTTKKESFDWGQVHGPSKEPQSNFDWNQTDEAPNEGFQGIGQDIIEHTLNTPNYAKEILRQLPGELKGASKMTLGRSLKNLGQGAENIATLPFDLGAETSDWIASKNIPYLSALAKHYPHIPKHDLFRLGKPQAGDTLIQSLVPFGGLGKAAKGLGRLKGLGVRAAGGALYSGAQGGNPIETLLTGTALEGLSRGAKGITQIPRRASNLKERVKAGVSNAILNKARRDIKSGGSLTPTSAARNALTQYTNIQGEPMGADFGTLVGNKVIQDIYNVGSKIPLTGGRRQLTALDKQLFDKKEELARVQHEKTKGTLRTEKAGFEQKLKQSIDALQKTKDIETHALPKLESEIKGLEKNNAFFANEAQKAPSRLESLRHPTTAHNTLIKEGAEKAFDTHQKEVNHAYKPFNDLKVDLNTMRMPTTFKSKYKAAYEDLKSQSEDLKELFDDDKDLGNNISKEIKKANSFFDENVSKNKAPGKELAASTTPFKFKKATPEAISTHIKTLQSLAEEAYAAGKHRQSSQLNKMASGLKDDMKTILNHNGYTEAVKALEAGDSLFKSKVLPFYKHREIKKLVSNKAHQLTDTTRTSISHALHQPELKVLLDALPKAAKDASIYELITRGKYGKSGHGLNPEQIASQYHTHIKSNVRESIENVNPALSHALENLNAMNEGAKESARQLTSLNSQKERLIKDIQVRGKKAETEKSRAESHIKSTEEKLRESGALFEKVMKERFGVPKAKTKSIFAALKQFSPLNAAGLGTALYAMGKISVPHIMEVVGASVLPFKLTNKILTEIENGKPKLLKHYVEGTKVKPKLK